MSLGTYCSQADSGVDTLHALTHPPPCLQDLSFCDEHHKRHRLDSVAALWKDVLRTEPHEAGPLIFEGLLLLLRGPNTLCDLFARAIWKAFFERMKACGVSGVLNWAVWPSAPSATETSAQGLRLKERLALKITKVCLNILIFNVDYS